MLIKKLTRNNLKNERRSVKKFFEFCVCCGAINTNFNTDSFIQIGFYATKSK